MIYKINLREVKKEEFENKLQKRIEEYIPYTTCHPPKEKIREILKEERFFVFKIYDKRYKDKLIPKDEEIFIAVEEEILDIENIVMENQFDPLNNDSLTIAVALYKAGYRKREEEKL